MDVFWDLVCFLTLFFIASCAVTYLLYLNRFDFWKKKGIKGPRPIFPYGNFREMIRDKIHNSHQYKKLYEATKHLPYAGVFAFYRPVLMINDLDLIKTVFVKDFVHFMDHTLPYNKKYEPLGGHLFNAKGSIWKSIRSKVSPAFTSNKMKYMFDTMAECGHSLEKYFESDSLMNSDIDIKDVMAKYTTDIIVSCALGIRNYSLSDPENEFRKMGQKLMNMNFKKGIVVFINLFAPALIEYLPLSFTDSDVSDFFINSIYNVIKHREENNLSRKDLMQLLIKLKNNESIEEKEDISQHSENNDITLSKLEIAAEAFGFFVAGFETSSTAMSCLLYELAENVDIQDKLRTEIIDILNEHDNAISYDSLNKMNYMTQVIEETLRKYPPIPHIFRLCTKDYILPDTNIIIDKGSRIVVSILGIHKDKNIYPDPEKFDPDRFLPENKMKRHNYSFLPFGEGPRICIGMRFAMMMMRIALASLLSRYEVLHSDTSKKGIEFHRRSIFLSPEGLKLKLNKLKKAV